MVRVRSIPIRVLRDRRKWRLSLAQALARYLVLDPEGPQLTYSQAAKVLGMEHGNEVGVHLKRAREKLAVQAGHHSKT